MNSWQSSRINIGFEKEYIITAYLPIISILKLKNIFETKNQICINVYYLY